MKPHKESGMHVQARLETASRAEAGAGTWLENRPPHQYHEHCGRRGSAVVSSLKDCWWLREHHAARGTVALGTRPGAILRHQSERSHAADSCHAWLEPPKPQSATQQLSAPQRGVAQTARAVVVELARLARWWAAIAQSTARPAKG